MDGLTSSASLVMTGNWQCSIIAPKAVCEWLCECVGERQKEKERERGVKANPLSGSKNNADHSLKFHMEHLRLKGPRGQIHPLKHHFIWNWNCNETTLFTIKFYYLVERLDKGKRFSKRVEAFAHHLIVIKMTVTVLPSSQHFSWDHIWSAHLRPCTGCWGTKEIFQLLKYFQYRC